MPAIPTPSDGIFNLTVDNPYQLVKSDFEKNSLCKDLAVTNGVIYCWVGDFKENNLSGITLIFPDRRVKYSIRFFAGAYSSLPDGLKADEATSLSSDGRIIVPQPPQSTTFYTWLSGMFKGNSDPWNGAKLKSAELRPGSESKRVLDTFTVDHANCDSDEKKDYPQRDSKTFIHEYKIRGSIGIDVPLPLISVQIGMTMEYKEGETAYHELNDTATLPGHKRGKWQVRWTESWQDGTALIEEKNGTEHSVEFSLKKDLGVEFVPLTITNCM